MQNKPEQYHSSIGFMRQQDAQARKEKIITLYLVLIVKIIFLCLCLIVSGVIFFSGNMAGDAIIQTPPAEIYLAPDDYDFSDMLEFGIDDDDCSEFFCISIEKMLFVRADGLILVSRKY